METIRQLLRHPAGKAGLTVGLTVGIFAALMGEASKALFLVGVCRYLAGKLARQV